MADLQAVVERDPACDTYVKPLLFFKGFQASGTEGGAGFAGGTCLPAQAWAFAGFAHRHAALQWQGDFGRS